MKRIRFTRSQIVLLAIFSFISVSLATASIFLWLQFFGNDHQPSSLTQTPADELIALLPSSSPVPSATLLPPATETPSPTSTHTPEPSPTPTATATFSPGVITYTVQLGDTLDSVAAYYGSSIEDIRSANWMYGDTVLPGQELAIPVGITVTMPAYQFSILEGNLSSAYPYVYDMGRIRLHYAPDTYPARAPGVLASMVETGLSMDEGIFQTGWGESIDVYAAGSLFEPPNRGLRGQSYSRNLRYMFLFDGSGNPTDQQYIITHELTHVYMWNAFGQPVSALLSEGAAVYAGMISISGTPGHMPVETFCAAYLQADSLPWISTGLNFDGHIFTLENYYAAGCFAGYLIETYGPSSFGSLYSSNDFYGIYGKSIVDLENEWRNHLAVLSIPAALDPQRLVQAVEDMEGAYWTFLPQFVGTPSQVEAYIELDQARIALLQGNLDLFYQWLSLFNE